MTNRPTKQAVCRFLLLIVLFGVGHAWADWVQYEAEEDLIISPESFVNFRPNANWSEDFVIYINGADPNDGWAALDVGVAGDWVTGVKVRAGYGPFYPDAFTDYTGAYRFWICKLTDLPQIGATPRDEEKYSEVTLYPNWDTMEFYSDADNHVWMETPGKLFVDADEALVVTSNWQWGFCDAMRIWVDPCNCGDPGTVYLPEDLVPDCYVNTPDFAVVAADYGQCTDPNDPCCGGDWGVLEEAEDGLFTGTVLMKDLPNASGASQEVVFMQTADTRVDVFTDVPGGNYWMYVRVRAGYLAGGAEPSYPEDFVDMSSNYRFFRDGVELTLVTASPVEFYNDTENFVWLRPTGPVSKGNGQLTVASHWAWGFVDVIRIDTTPAACGDLGTQYLPGDLTADCRVNLLDVSHVASVWLNCSDPANPACDIY